MIASVHLTGSDLIALCGLMAMMFIVVYVVTAYFKPQRYYKRLAKKQLRQLVEKRGVHEKIELLHNCHPLAFEELVILIFHRCRNVKCRSTGFTRDGGFDGFARITQDNKTLNVGIQSKRYQRGYINRKHLLQFSYVCKRRELVPLFVYVGKISEENSKLARRIGVEMFNEVSILHLIECRKLELGDKNGKK